MTNAPTKIVASLIGLALLVGCVEKEKEDPAETFKTALADYYRAEGCVGFSPIHGYPAPVVKGESFPLRLKETQFASADNLDALVSAGLLMTVEGYVKRTVETKSGVKEVWDRVRDYHLTEPGRKSLKDPNGQTFCRNDVEVVRVLHWTEPVVKGGKTLCEVTFEIRPTNVAEWAKHPEVVKAMSMLRRSLKEDADKPKKVKKLMVLSDQGWVVKGR